MQAQKNAGRVEISTSRAKTLLDLPPEVILQIVDFLPTTSAASFALCNKQSAAQLGSRSWTLLSGLDTEDHLHFLSILSRDLPRYHACHGRIRLHLSSSIPHPASINTPPQPSSCIPASARGGYSENGHILISIYFSPYRLRFPHVQLALKHDHHGPDHGIPLTDLSHTEIQFVQGIVFFFSVDARIASSEMVVRSQEWVISSQHPREHFLSRTLIHGVCQHLMTYNAEFDLDDSFTSLIRCRLDHGAADDDCACMRLHQFPSCCMEYQVDVVDFKERGTAICTTKWLNLGAGLTTGDPKWRGHNLLPHEYVPHNTPLGSIRSSYESQAGASVDDLTSENRRRLLSSLRVIGRSVHLCTDACDWKLAGHNIWYIGPLKDSNTTSPFLHQLLASASSIITRFFGDLF